MSSWGVIELERIDWHLMESQTIAWMREAGQKIKNSLALPLEVSSKSAPNDLVTNMDRSIEKFLIEKIRTNYPGHQIVSEEGFGDKPQTTAGVIWFVDPIDGTMNFVKQQRFFAISIGVYENGKGRAAFIYDVMNNEIFHCLSGEGAYRNDDKLDRLGNVAVRDALIDLSTAWIKPNKRIDQDVLTELVLKCGGTRSYGAASLELAYVAAGLLHGYFTMRLSPWDYAAGLIIIQEVGGVATRVDGTPINILSRTSVLAAGPELHHEMVSHIRSQIDAGKFVKEPDSAY